MRAFDAIGLRRRNKPSKSIPETLQEFITLANTVPALLRPGFLWGGDRELCGGDRNLSLANGYEAVRQGDSPALLHLFVLTIDTGLRASETRSLHRKDLELEWKDGAIVAGKLIVPKSKTEAGEARAIPLTRKVCAALTL